MVILLTVIVRGGLAISTFEQLEQDPDAYQAIAETLSETGVFGVPSGEPGGEGVIARPTAFRPPLYPYLLSFLVIDGALDTRLVAVFHVALGLITSLCTLAISRQLIDHGETGPKSLIATSLVIFDPLLLQQASLVMTETLATALAAIVIWLWVAWVTSIPREISPESSWPVDSSLAVLGRTMIFKAVALGLALSAAYLCRPTFLVWAVLMLPMIYFAVPATWRIRMVAVLATACVLFLTVGLWTFRNQQVIGKPIWATTHGGYTLLLGNNPSFYQYLRDGKFGQAWDAEPFLKAYAHRFDADPRSDEFWKRDWTETPISEPASVHNPTSTAKPMPEPLTEYDDDRLAYEAARATIANEPKMFLWSCLVRVARLWSPMPHYVQGRSPQAVIAVTAYYLFFYTFLVIGLIRLNRYAIGRQWWVIWTLVATLSLVHAVYWSNMRMRSPAMIGLAAIAANGLVPKKLALRPGIAEGCLLIP